MALADHRMRQEAWAKSKQQRAMLPNAYGEYLPKLAEWDWFVTITFRDILPRDLAIARKGGAALIASAVSNGSDPRSLAPTLTDVCFANRSGF